jgi:hypothetical protein
MLDCEVLECLEPRKRGVRICHPHWNRRVRLDPPVTYDIWLEAMSGYAPTVWRSWT